MRFWYFLAALPLLAQSPEPCHALRHRGRIAEARACYTTLTRSQPGYLRAEGFWGLGDYEAANNQFRAAVKADPENIKYKVRWGRMFLDHYQPADAGELFAEALKAEPENAGALLGEALVYAEGFDQKAAELAEKALKADPKNIEARELLARLALEDSDPKKAAELADQALQASPEALQALALHAAIELLAEKPGKEWLDRMAAINPVYGEGWETIGHFFVLNRRYDEGIAAYRKAIELTPTLYRAMAELGINLMRLGQEADARKLLERAFESGYKSAAVTNTLRLMDSYKNFITHTTPTTVLRLHKKEDELLLPYFQDEMERAVAVYEKKYKWKLERPVQIEVYPDHEDFAVRTLGIPGLGALGVTFGYVVAMDSPSGRKPGAFHWASVLWHEMSHVYVLTLTNYRVPRWFTEGLAVHEETAIHKDWGDRLDHETITAIQKKKLLPIAELDRGFIRPTYPSQVTVSYFQAGRICDYIEGKWGFPKLLDMIHDFAKLESTPAVIEKNLGMKPDQFDKEFLAWLEEQTKSQVEGFERWRKGMKNLSELAKANKYDEVLASGKDLIKLYPDYVESNSVYEMLADASIAKGDKAGAAEILEQYSRTGGRYPGPIKKLATLEVDLGRKKEAAATLERLNYIYPQDEDLHRRLGSLYLDLGDPKTAVREYHAVVAMKPLDVASARYDLARAMKAAGRTDEARDQVLLALEAAPGFKAAQRLLLELGAK